MLIRRAFSIKSVCTFHLLMLASWPPAFGDQWAQPTAQAVFSPNGAFFVRLVPGSDEMTSRALFYALRSRDQSYRLNAEVNLWNRVFPAYAHVSNEGHLITFDDWESVGRATVETFYRPDGSLIREVGIDELYQASELGQFTTSVTMRLWRCSIRGDVTENEEPIVRVVGIGAVFTFYPRTGVIERVRARVECDSLAELDRFAPLP
jgi:hypothetical protein